MDPVIDSLLTPALANGAGVVTVVLIVGLMVMRGNLVPGRTHREALRESAKREAKAEDRADRWEQVALQTLRATERLAEPMAVTAKVLTKLPNPSQEGAGA